jgi:4-amino-4-deoxy-L-arabinose transferase-like glycosyltransferase
LSLFLILPGALLYPCLSFHLFEPDEGRYAEIPREMLSRGEWVVPSLEREPYLDKPPLMYWLVMGSYRLLGVHVWSARLVPAVAVHACVLLLYFLGRRSVGERAAFWGALALGLSPGFLGMGRLLLLDGLLSFWVTLAVLAAFEAVRAGRLRRGWWLTAAAACGLGVLTKGPVAVLLVLPPLWGFRRLTRLSCPVGLWGWLSFAAVLLALTSPWYVAVCVRRPDFIHYFLWQQNVVRFVAPFDHLKPVWYYGPIVLGGLLPLSLLAVSFLRFLLASDPATARRRCPELGFLLLAGGWCLLFFSLSGCKLPTYVLPGFPLLALALGYFVAVSRWRVSRWRVPAVGLMLLLLGAGHYVAVPWYARFHSPMSHPDEVVRHCGDRSTPVICYPRNCDSVSFYLGRDDFLNYRSKETPELVRFLLEQPRAVILFTHRHSLESLREVLPPPLRLTDITPLSGSWARGFRPEMCYMAVVQRTDRKP